MHAIHAYILKKKDLTSDIKFKDLDVEGLIISIEEPTVKNGSLYLEVQTDYFGGFGEQHCWSHAKDNMPTVVKLSSINEGLKLLDVIKKEDMDEFDTVGLGEYRSTQNIFPEDFKYEFTHDIQDESEETVDDVVMTYTAKRVIHILAEYMIEQETKDINSMGLSTEEAERLAEKWLVKNVEGFENK